MHPVEKAYHRMRKTAEGNPSSAVFSLDLDAFFEWTATEFYDHRFNILKKSYKLTPPHQQTCNLKIVEVQKEEGPKGDEEKAGEDKDGTVEVNSPMKPITETEQKQTRKRKTFAPLFDPDLVEKAVADGKLDTID
ncbi:hypothetical protein CYMTET_35835 [Cymbomonas tetramitiformis]|uniref:Uncharacterized protein n=1 Tax=Cymbomonas tetramitiformis TaxID=36881 RepID=A0AAE0F8F0_9CHLO|nr:hypothetical protein CYMTET_35835 [Cymbomonas tetramitiformis]